MTLFKQAAALAITLTFTATSAHANLILNGGFENGSHRDDGSNYMRLNPGDSQLDNWTIDSTIAWGLNPTDSFSASQGAGFVDLSSFSNQSLTGEISQNVSTSVGTTYLLSIERQGFGSTVSLGGVDITLSPGETNGAWTTFTAEIVASSTNLLFSVKNTSGGSSIVFVDAISLVEVIDTKPVPEPGTLGLLGLGLLGLALVRRKQVAE